MDKLLVAGNCPVASVTVIKEEGNLNYLLCRINCILTMAPHLDQTIISIKQHSHALFLFSFYFWCFQIGPVL